MRTGVTAVHHSARFALRISITITGHIEQGHQAWDIAMDEGMILSVRRPDENKQARHLALVTVAWFVLCHTPLLAATIEGDTLRIDCYMFNIPGYQNTYLGPMDFLFNNGNEVSTQDNLGNPVTIRADVIPGDTPYKLTLSGIVLGSDIGSSTDVSINDIDIMENGHSIPGLLSSMLVTPDPLFISTTNPGGVDYDSNGYGIDFAPAFRARDIKQNSYNVVIQFGISKLGIGDYNRSGHVDAADYTVWRNSLGQTGMNLAADGNGNNMIDPDDYGVWKMHFGETAGAGSGSAGASPSPVPEPASWVLVIGSLLMTWRQRQRTS